MQERGEFVVNVRGEMFVRQEFINARAQDRDRRLQLVRGVRGKSGGTLQLDAGRLERGFRALALRAVLLRGYGEPFHRPGEAARNNVARAQSAEEQQCPGDDDVLANLSLTRDRVRQRINRDLVRRRIQRTGVQLLVKKQNAAATDLHLEAALVAGWRQPAPFHFRAERRCSLSVNAAESAPAQPNAALDFGPRATAAELDRP